MAPQDSFPLHGTNVRLPSRGIGTFQPNPEDYPEGSVTASVIYALKIGYRHIDAAFAYGRGSVERDVGEALRKSGVPREEIFITTKLDNTFHAPEDVAVGMRMSLENLGLDYVDLYLMHWPFAFTKKEDYSTKSYPDGKPVMNLELSRQFDRTWAAMESLVDQGKTKFIGLSNFSSPKIQRLLQTCRIHPVVNQIELHPYFPQKGLLKFCKEKNIHVTAYGPLGCTPEPFLKGYHGPSPLEDANIVSIAEKYKRTTAQVILSHLINIGVSVIPKSNHDNRISENFDCLFEMDEADHAIIDNLMGTLGEKGVRHLDTKDYIGFDTFNEEVEEP